MQIILKINNSYSQITGLESQKMKMLKNILSYDIDSSAAYFSNNKFNTKRYLIDNKGSFPTGLLNLVKSFIAQNAIKCSIIDERIKPSNHISLNPKFKHKPYKSQLAACSAAKTTGTLSMPTGSGKSLVIALIIAKFKVKTLVIVPNLEIKKQLTESLQEIFGKLNHITVENIDSANLEKPNNFDCLIIDEAHHSAAKTYQNLNKKHWTNIYHRFFLTATPFRNNKDENLLFQAIAGEVIYNLSYKDAIKEGYIVPIEAYYVELPKVKNDLYTWQEVYKELVVNNEARNNLIARLMLNAVENNLSTLCLVKEIKHGTNLAELTNLQFANGEDQETRIYIQQFNKKQIIGLIGTSGIIGEGVDTKPCEVVIIAGLGKAKSALMQQFGRAVRTYEGKAVATIILIKDSSHKFTLRHFKEQCKILKDEYGVIPVKMEV